MNIEKLIVKEIQNLMNSGQSLNGAIHLFCNDFGADLTEVQTIVNNSKINRARPWLSQTRVSIADQFQMAGEPLGGDEG
jgi:hypothetical protein|tara:strand:+ start:1547 stop:1783 length:237 start_codon:yes stop_codon:yes gene_type:complete